MIDFGRGVRLGPIEPTHERRLMDWRNNREIWKWCRQHDVISERDHFDWLERQHKDPSIRMYVVHAGDENLAVGACGLTSIDPINRRAEFSLYIAAEHWGNGYGSRALQTLVNHGFLNLGLNSIWGESFDKNPAMAMFEKLGFQKEGIRRQFYFRNGEWVDAHLFSVLASEWKWYKAQPSQS